MILCHFFLLFFLVFCRSPIYICLRAAPAPLLFSNYCFQFVKLTKQDLLFNGNCRSIQQKLNIRIKQNLTAGWPHNSVRTSRKRNKEVFPIPIHSFLHQNFNYNFLDLFTFQKPLTNKFGNILNSILVLSSKTWAHIKRQNLFHRKFPETHFSKPSTLTLYENVKIYLNVTRNQPKHVKRISHKDTWLEFTF